METLSNIRFAIFVEEFGFRLVFLFKFFPLLFFCFSVCYDGIRNGVILIKSKELHMTAFVLVVVGAVNWGLWGLFNLDLVDMLLGGWPILARLVYVLVGLSGVYIFATHKEICTYCMGTTKKSRK